MLQMVWEHFKNAPAVFDLRKETIWLAFASQGDAFFTRSPKRLSALATGAKSRCFRCGLDLTGAEGGTHRRLLRFFGRFTAMP